MEADAIRLEEYNIYYYVNCLWVRCSASSWVRANCAHGKVPTGKVISHLGWQLAYAHGSVERLLYSF